VSKWIRSTQTTKGTDPNLALVGGPEAGNMAGLGLIVPNIGTVNAHSRNLCALAMFAFHGNQRARIVSFKQMLTIATDVPTAQAGVTILRECQVTDPFWSFPDGNVIWYFRTVPLITRHPQQVTTPPDGFAVDLYPTTPTQVVQFWSGAGSPPANNGVPGGEPIDMLPALRTVVSPYGRNAPGENLKVEVPTPCRLFVYASIWQPNNQAPRITPDVGLGQDALIGDSGLCREDRFWASYPDSRYYRIGCELTVETKLSYGDRCETPGG
jgi:hypothetical protein